MKKYCIFLFLICAQFSIFAQELVYENHIYDDKIHSLRLYEGDLENVYPVLTLGSAEKLTLIFDELIGIEEPFSSFQMDFISCDAEWKPSNLMPMEFYNGFTDKQITDYTRSDNTRVPYVHYKTSFPEEGESFRMSGNYLLRVYRNSDDKNTVFTLRFMVAENKLGLQTQIGGMSLGGLRVRLSQLFFEIENNQGLNIFNPDTDMKLVMLQNGRWDNAATKVPASFNLGTKFQYRVNVNELFPTGNEFRRMDIRSSKLYGLTIDDISLEEEVFNVHVQKESPRIMNTFSALQDFNGGYLLRAADKEFPDYQGDYMNCHFTMKASEPYDGLNMFLNGGFCNYQLSDFNKLTYNEKLRQYEGEMLLKQGMYDYQYLLQNPITKTINESLLEGEFKERENFYTVLVYFKSFSDRNHQLIGFFPINY
jgi:hypothetical protein